jgi:hypothetical protein
MVDKLEITVNVPSKSLNIDGESVRLDDSFQDAEVEGEDCVVLKYKGCFDDEDALFVDEENKLRKTYGDSLYEKVSVDLYHEGDDHYMSFSGNIRSRVIGRKCYDILQPLECRERRTV